MLRACAVEFAAVSARDEFASLRPRERIVFSVPPGAWFRRAVRPRRR
jgi:hypothetical protein